MEKRSPFKKTLSANMEDYLEAIAYLKNHRGVARVKDISEHMNVKRPSVTGALAVLLKNGLIVHERYGYVDLTPQGAQLALNVQRRHDALIKFLTTVLRIEPFIAQKDACRMEHAMSVQTFQRLVQFINFFEQYPEGRNFPWLGELIYDGKRRRHLRSGKNHRENKKR